MQNNFLSRATTIELAPFQEAQFWIINLQDIQKTEVLSAETFLDIQTQNKTRKLIPEDGRNRSIITHAILRYQLSKLICCAPDKVELMLNKFGKPYLKNNFTYFNIAHTKDFAFIAFHPNRPIGIDIEKLDEKIDALKLSDNFMSPDEKKVLLANPNQATDYFFSFWCAKEAFLKALGTGLVIKKIPEIYPNFDEFDTISSFDSKDSQKIFVYDKKIEYHKLAVYVIQQENPTILG